MSDVVRSFATDLLAASKFHARETALIDASTGEALDFETAISQVGGIAAQFEEKGVSPAGNVVSLLPNACRHFLYFNAVVASGRGFLALSPETTTRELGAALSAVKPVAALAPPFLPGVLRRELDAAGVPVSEVDFSKPDAIQARADFLRRSKGGGALLVRTSGTTGEPKYLRHGIDALWSAGRSFAEHHRELVRGGRFINIYSFDYLASVFNCGLIPWSVGAGIVFDGDFHRRGSTTRLWHSVSAHDVTVLWLTPRMLKDLTRDLDTPLAPFAQDAAKNLSTVFVGMASITNENKARFERGFGVPVMENYALTETTFLTSETAASRNRGVAASSGALLPWVEARLIDIDDEDRALGDDVGEIAVKTPYLASAVIGPDGGEESLPTDADGFYRTADAGVLAATGDLRLAGRLRDIIKREDGLVQLREVEIAAEEDPAVETAAAVAVPHEFRGESFVLFVSGSDLDGAPRDALERRLHDKLPRRIWPETVRAVRRMPLTRSGKVAKPALLALLADPATNGSTE
ncbi:MAG: class I adenylate-forming enzyme family protein [Parvularculaceae bacterium]